MIICCDRPLKCNTFSVRPYNVCLFSKFKWVTFLGICHGQTDKMSWDSRCHGAPNDCIDSPSSFVYYSGLSNFLLESGLWYFGVLPICPIELFCGSCRISLLLFIDSQCINQSIGRFFLLHFAWLFDWCSVQLGSPTRPFQRETLGCILLGFQNLLNYEQNRLQSPQQPETKRMRIMKTAELEMKAIFIGWKLVTMTFL